MEQIFRLLPGDVGRPITDIVSTLDYPELADSARQVMKSLIIAEREAAAADGRWFAVRMLPYRSFDDRVDGVVITFTDITTAKSLEAALRQAQASLEARLADTTADGTASSTPEHTS
jgi:two-component system CheB/CheR fusion protein